MISSPLLTLKEAAAKLRIHPQTLRKLLQEGRLKVKYLQLGGWHGAMRVYADSLDNFIRNESLD